ncbi:MAG: hypothetical protein KF856_19215 [Cyclobacteriaceae bacterium]|nr:hypothetical protein [Cyclobacteriaceae bacterium]
MRLIPGLMLLCIFGCTAKHSTETLVHDTLKVDSIIVAEDVVAEVIEPLPKPEPIIVTDSTANVLKNLVDAKFDSLYQLISDTSLFYKVELEDYYDEYEGQDQKKTIKWYFNKSLDPIYVHYIFESGSLDQPEITEYIISNEKIHALKKEARLYGPDSGRKFTKWDKMNGGIILNWSEYWKKVKSIEPLTDEDLKGISDEHDSNLSLLKTTLDKEEPITSDEEVYSIEIREPKHADLVDYTYVTIPKAVYNKLRK